MTKRTKIVIVEGPDNSGKTTLINKLTKNGLTLINFPKRTTEGILKCSSRNEVTIFETMLNYLDRTKTYMLDRSYISNIVYEGIRGNDVSVYIEDIHRLLNNNDIIIIGLTRNKIDFDFVDDNIKLNKEMFNRVIDEYNRIYSELNIKPIKILEHCSKNKVVHVNEFDISF